MNIVLLSGGSGKRLWPLSNEIRSKQFLKILKNDQGVYESMVQRMYRQISSVDKETDITIATSKAQISTIISQLGGKVGISLEPCRRDTFPAIALTAAYLHDVKGLHDNEVVVVCPVDPYVEKEYFEALKELSILAEKGNSNLMLLGIEPTYPSDKYGYIIPETTDKVSRVVTFKEKPDTKTAQDYLSKGALWNGGVFAFKLKYLLDKAHELIDFIDYEDLFNRYEMVERISFDYAVVEKESNIQVMRFSGRWKDLGTWNTLTESIEEKVIGNAMLNESCENVHVVNELDIPVLCMGLKNTIVSVSAEGILVSDKNESGQIKPYVDKIEQPVMFSEKSWGEYRVLDISENSMVIKATLKAGQKMSYHSHEKREEIWNIISGNGRAIVDGVEYAVKMGDTIAIKAGCKHTLVADVELNVIEVQSGQKINVNDKQKYELR